MTNTAYTITTRLALLNATLKGIAVPTWDVYLGLYSSDPATEVDVERVHMPPSEWTVTSNATDAYATNKYEISFTDVPASVLNGVLLFDGDDGTEYLMAKAFTTGSLTVTSTQVLRLDIGAIRISFDEV